MSASTSSSILDLSVVELAQLIRQKKLSPVEVTTAHIERIQEINPYINALVAERFDLALQEAHSAERKLQHDEIDVAKQALFGVPCTVKEFWAVRGLPQTGGMVHRKECISEDDAEIIKRVRAAGAIVLGGTNVPEGGMWAESDNRLYGRTNNPWDLSRTSGGSSGGDGAIVGAGGAPFAISSDIGGSIRLPAAFCGACGHKPTGNLVPNQGHFPPAPEQISNYLTGGPIARRCQDLLAVLRVIADSQHNVALPLSSDELPKSDELKVFFATDNGRYRVSECVQQAVMQSVNALREQGAQIQELDEPRLKKSFEIWTSMIGEAQDGSYGELLAEGQELEILREVFKIMVGRSDHTPHAIGMAALDRVFRKLPERFAPIKQLATEGRSLKQDLETLLGERGILIYPAYSRTAPPHNFTVLNPLDIAYTAIFNVLEFPSTVLPICRDEDGLPIAVQVIGPRGADRLCLHVAELLERQFGGWKRAEPTRAPRRDSMIERLRAARK
ncbi:MAG: amidase [Myxococcales bacterium]|nr:MAG: amidase [Myxococcales bacterium]